MQHLILKTDLEQNKIDALLQFLKSWDIDVEWKTTQPPAANKKAPFTLAEGIWKDYNINANELRSKAWNRGK